MRRYVPLGMLGGSASWVRRWWEVQVEAVLRLADVLEAAGDRFDLFSAVLCLPGLEGPLPDARRWSAAVDELADGLDCVAALRRRLFDELGFRGDTEEYDHPRNSFLPDVIERRRGLPITLTVLCAEVARRARLDVRVVGMPGHVLALDVADGTWFDPFHGGEVLNLAGCEARFRQVTGAGPDVLFGPDDLPALDSPRILARMIDNLVRSYQVRRRHRQVELALRMRRMLPGFGLPHLVALGEAIAAQGRLN